MYRIILVSVNLCKNVYFNLIRCFERGKNEHSDTCKKKKSKLFISNVLPSVKDPKDFEKHSVYSDSYVKFDLGASKDNDVSILL